MGHHDQAADSRSLRARIDATEEALRQHRLQSSMMAGALENRVRSRIASPAAITIAAGFGFALGKRKSQGGSYSLLNLLKTATQASLLHRALQ